MASSPKIDDLKKKFDENPRRYFAPLANEYRKAGEIDQAIAICREYLPQQPGHMSGHIVFGQALYEARQLDEAKTVFETALSLDPENLIALKHLGDITLLAGDREAAKGWYKRVLEADPRNEETQAQLKSIEQSEGAAPTPVASLSTQATQPVPTAKPAAAAASAPTVVMSAVKPPSPKIETKPAAAPAAPSPPAGLPQPAAAPSATSPTAEIRVEGLTRGEPPATKPGAGVPAVAATVIMEAPHGVSPVKPTEAPPVTPALGLETTSMASGPEAPPLDSFSLEGLESTSLAPAAAPPQPAAAAPAPPTIELELPTAPPAAAPAPAAELPTIDLEFAAPAVPAAAAAPEPAPPTLPAAAPDEPGLVDLQVDLPPVSPAPSPVVASPPSPPPTVVEPPPAPAPVALDAPAPAELPMIDVEVPAAAPPAVPAVPPAQAGAEAAPFVTETMAELYLQQGHIEEALRVYRALLEQRPGDAALLATVARLEAPPAAPPAAQAPAAPPLAHVGGPSIRSILLLIAERRPGHRPAGSGQNGGAPALVAEPEMAPPTPAASPTPPAGGSAPERLAVDALAALWGNAPPDAREETAAVMLAVAFADLSGMHQAAADSGVTGGASAPTAPGSVAPPSSFSFDKFFSQRVTAEHATQVPGAAAPAESQEDVAKFTRWLEGLKQQ